MASNETKKKCQHYSINVFGVEWKLNLVTRGASSKMFEKPWFRIKLTFYTKRDGSVLVYG